MRPRKASGMTPWRLRDLDSLRERRKVCRSWFEAESFGLRSGAKIEISISWKVRSMMPLASPIVPTARAVRRRPSP
jgi:hypothetical protein